jgi:hypothetical protein
MDQRVGASSLRAPLVHTRARVPLFQQRSAAEKPLGFGSEP